LKIDGFVKSPSAALRSNFVFAAHPDSAPHSSVFARLASGAFYKAVVPLTFYEIIKIAPRQVPFCGPEAKALFRRYPFISR
jgi:hypothetical protein